MPLPSSRPLSRRAWMAGAAGTLALAGVTARRGEAQPAKPNIVFIMADDLGYADVSCYGRHDYSTPNIDRIAAGGVHFLQAYANSAVCSATRTALITGRYQYRLPIGLEEPLASASTRDIGLPPSHPTLPSLLKAAGYGTTLIGKWHLGKLPNYGPLKSGYDHFWGFRGGSLDYFTHKSGPPHTDTDDLWDGDVKIHQVGYLTDLLGDRAVSEINELRAIRAALPDQPALQRATLALGGARTTRPRRSGSPRCSISTAGRSALTRAWSCRWTCRSAASCRRSRPTASPTTPS